MTFFVEICHSIPLDSEVIDHNNMPPKVRLFYSVCDSPHLKQSGNSLYLNQGMSQADAEAKAFQDMQDASEPVQQSSDPSLISPQQASILGRMLLAFQNVTMQYTRRMKKAVIDLAKGRGDFKTNVSRIVYYGAVQNLVFNALQSALFALAFDDEEDEVKIRRRDRVANGMVDSILRGLGIPGAIFARTIEY